MLRRIQIQPDDVGGLAFKLRIIAGHLAIQPVRPQLGLRQYPLHRGFADARLLGQFAASPMRAVVVGLLPCATEDTGLHSRGDRAWPAAPVLLVNQPCLLVRNGSSTSIRSAHWLPVSARSFDSSARRRAEGPAVLERHHPPGALATAPTAPTLLPARN
jgi:hypothetical protein